jgi:thymidylate kinase
VTEALTDALTQDPVAGSILAMQVLDGFRAQGVAYCLLRPSVPSERKPVVVEVDLLVDPSARTASEKVLRDLGFARLRAWGHAPHRFWVGYESAADRWIKLDLVDRLAFGKRTKCLPSSLAAACFADRYLEGGIYHANPASAAVALLLHCTLDKQRFSPAHHREMERLLDRVPDMALLDTALAQNWGPSLSSTRLVELVASGRWDAPLEKRGQVIRHLFWQAPVSTACAAIVQPVLRKLGRLLPKLRGRLPRVAVLAPDGAGKTTLIGALSSAFILPVQSIYMGLYGANERARAVLPGFGLALSMSRQWFRYARALYHGLRGRLVLFDRYTYDALVGTRPHERVHQRLRRWLLAHACPAPDLVVILDAPGAVLAARKPEHSAALLEQRRQRLLALTPRLGRCAVVDATAGPAEVRRAVTGIIWRSLTCTSLATAAN